MSSSGPLATGTEVLECVQRDNVTKRVLEGETASCPGGCVNAKEYFLGRVGQARGEGY